MRVFFGVAIFMVLTSLHANAYDFFTNSYNGPSTLSQQLLQTSNLMPQAGYSPIPNYFGASVGYGIQAGGPYSFMPTPPWYAPPGSYDFGMGLGMRYGIHGPGLMPAGSATAAYFQAKFGQRQQPACSWVCPSRCEYHECSTRHSRRRTIEREPPRPPPPPPAKPEEPKPSPTDVPPPPPPAPVIDKDEPPKVQEPKQVNSCEAFRDVQRTEAGTLAPLCTEESCGDPNLKAAAPIGSRRLRDIIEQVPQSTVVGAARSVMATIYQDCSVLAENNVMCPLDTIEGYTGDGTKSFPRKIENPAKVLNSHPYLKQLTHGNVNFCKTPDYKARTKCDSFNICDRPPLFVWGGKTAMDKGQLEVTGRVNNVEESDRSGLDCSGFVTGSLQAAGLKVRNDMNNNVMDTRALLTMGENSGHGGTDCLAPVKLDRHNSNFLKPGDIMVWAGHTFMIETTKDDPLGIQNTIEELTVGGNADRCEDAIDRNFTPEKFNFNLIMSGTLQTAGMGVFRIRGQDYFPKSNEFTEYLKQMAIKSCKAQMPVTKGRSADKDLEAVVTKDKSSQREFAVIRHNLDTFKKDRCAYKEVPKIECGITNCGASE